MTVITSTEQLHDSVGKLVQIQGVLRTSRRGTYVSAYENIDLAPPPSPSAAKEGSEISVIGILGSRQIEPYVAQSLDTAVAREANPVGRTEYYITDYKLVPLDEKP